jgi:hypothetical protein
LGCAQQVVEPVEAGIPSGDALGDPLAGIFKAGSAGTNDVLASVAPPLNEAGVLEHA